MLSLSSPLRPHRVCATGLLAAVVLLVLALPSAALAQSAGDDQYSDPFGQVDEDTGGGGDDAGNGGGNLPAESQPAPAAAPAPAPAPGDAGTETAVPTGETLPRSGPPSFALAIIGAASLAGGAVLRRRL